MATLEQRGSVDSANQMNLPVTQLEFNQAMADFKIMFPDLEEAVIEMVLRSNNGAVDVTIDQLLAMSNDNENQKAPKSKSAIEKDIIVDEQVPPRYYSATPPPTYQQAVPGVSRILGNKYSTSESLRIKHCWNPPLIGPLPDGFLRIAPYDSYDSYNLRGLAGATFSPEGLIQKIKENDRQRRLSKDADDTETAQYLDDERLAIFLQNEEFMRELRGNKDFMSTLNMDPAFQSRSFDEVLPDGPSVPSHEDDAAFKEKLRNMGKASRKKFAQFAKIFSRRRRPTFPHLLGGHDDKSSSGRENLFGDDSYTPFENEGSDHERTGRHPWGSPRRRSNTRG